MNNPFNDIKELYQQEQHRRKQEEEKIKRDHEKRQVEENKIIAEKTSQRFIQFRQPVNDLSPMIDKVLYQFGDQVWGFTTKTDYKYEKRWYGLKQVPYNYEIKNYVMRNWKNQYIADGLIYIIAGEKNYITGEHYHYYGEKRKHCLPSSKGKPVCGCFFNQPNITDIDGNTDGYSTKIYRLYSHNLISYIFRNNEAYLVGFCQHFYEDVDVDVLECTGLIVASAIAKQCGKVEVIHHEGGYFNQQYFWGVEFKIQTEKLISADESSLIEALKELFKLQHQL
jgi:hypothetical protein